MDELKKTIEAALFMSGRWLTVEDLKRITGSGSIGDIKERLSALQHEYEKHSGGVMVFEESGKYRMEVARDIRDRVYYLAPEPELSPALIKTLAFIAYKQPVNQSQVVRVIGNRAYEYIKELRRKEFISIKRKGRTKEMTTTGRFRKYFGLKEGEMPWADMKEAEELLTAGEEKLEGVQTDLSGVPVTDNEDDREDLLERKTPETGGPQTDGGPDDDLGEPEEEPEDPSLSEPEEEKGEELEDDTDSDLTKKDGPMGAETL